MLKSFVGASDFSVNLYKDKNFLQELQRVNNTTLGPGPALDYQNLRANNSINELIDQTLEHGSVKIGLYMWIRHIITIGATDGVFGTSNPFLKQKNRDIFWEWQTAALPLWAGLDVFVPKQVKAREQLVKALANYHRGDHSDAAEVTKQRAAVHQRHGCPEEDIARIHLAFSQGVLPNTVPTAFWMVFEVFSRPQLLQRLRLEIMEHAVHVDKPIQTIELDVAALKTRCSLLLACLEETQRTRGQHATIRKVQEDTMVGPFLLKKNAYLQIPSQTVHFDPTIWGDDPYRFNPDRFLDMYASPRSASSFTAWGVAPHLCPARQFAATEILVLIALLVLRVDIEPIAGEWRELRVMKNAMTTILPPEEGNDFDVELVPRDGWQGNWMLKMGESRTKVPLFSG
jgi:cytochrome P450